MSLFRDKKKKKRGRFNNIKLDKTINELVKKLERKGKK